MDIPSTQKITRFAALLLVGIAVVLALVALLQGRHPAKASEANPAGTAVGAKSVTGASGEDRVVVAERPLRAGAPIPPDALGFAARQPRPADGYGDIAQVAGGIPRIDIPSGAPITATLLANDLSAALHPGERALAVPVNELTGVAHRIVPGDYVDVFLVLKGSRTTDVGMPPGLAQSRLLLSRLRVLAYGAHDLPTATPEKSAAAASVKPAAKETLARTAVLAVPLESVDRLLLGAQEGQLSLALRNPRDDDQPGLALFPQPRAVLEAAPGLSADQRAALGKPANRAFAGIDGAGLAGRGEAPVFRPHHLSSGGIEIIRGAQRGQTANAGKLLP